MVGAVWWMSTIWHGRNENSSALSELFISSELCWCICPSSLEFALTGFQTCGVAAEKDSGRCMRGFGGKKTGLGYMSGTCEIHPKSRWMCYSSLHLSLNIERHFLYIYLFCCVLNLISGTNAMRMMLMLGWSSNRVLDSLHLQRYNLLCNLFSCVFMFFFFSLSSSVYPFGMKKHVLEVGNGNWGCGRPGHGKMLIAYMWHIKMDWIQATRVSWDWNVTLAGFYFSMRTCSDFTTSRLCVTGICFKFT